MAKNWILGLGETAVGLFLLSPADEAISGVATWGASGVALPVQLTASAAAGAYLVYDGLKRI